MGSDGKIVVDTAFITSVRTEICKIRDGIPALLAGVGAVESLEQMLVKIGTADYLRGVKTAEAVDHAGATLTGRLTGYGTTLDQLDYGLMTFLEEQEKVEDLNKVSADDLMEHIDYTTPSS
ncbi:MAG TPA: hypothetical protein VN408_03350 [Actinoplanes sp.]|nr:hypothetical protein [Actinoplanes sp.]